jgi:hypothetical protein
LQGTGPPAWDTSFLSSHHHHLTTCVSPPPPPPHAHRKSPGLSPPRRDVGHHLFASPNGSGWSGLGIGEGRPRESETGRAARCVRRRTAYGLPPKSLHPLCRPLLMTTPPDPRRRSACTNNPGLSSTAHTPQNPPFTSHLHLGILTLPPMHMHISQDTQSRRCSSGLPRGVANERWGGAGNRK